MNLKSLVKKPDEKQMAFIVEGGDLVDFDPDQYEVEAGSPPREPDLVLRLRYMPRDEYQRLLVSDHVDKNASRRVVSPKGMKAMVQKAIDPMTRGVVERCLIEWQMNVRAAFALQLEADLKALKPDERVPFNTENLETMLQHSVFGGFVHGLAIDHKRWFDIAEAEGESEKNSGSGPSSSTAN